MRLVIRERAGETVHATYASPRAAALAWRGYNDLTRRERVLIAILDDGTSAPCLIQGGGDWWEMGYWTEADGFVRLASETPAERAQDTRKIEAAEVLTDALGATGLSQVRLARDVLGVNDRSLRQWLAGEPCWPPVVRLAWLLARHPEMAAELSTEFGEPAR